jgi:Raf kinase inhibitor-like YbhB/YbcL family protein
MAGKTSGNLVLYWILLLAAFISLFGEDKMALTITSPAFSDGGEIPSRYTCDGNDVSPPLQWDGVSDQARSMVLIVDDPDAPDPKAPKRTWVHWVLYNLPPTSSGLGEAVGAADLPEGTEIGVNDSGQTGFGSPCPPIGRHRYFFKLYALDTDLSFSGAPTKAQVEAAMEGHILQSAEVVGTYEKR